MNFAIGNTCIPFMLRAMSDNLILTDLMIKK